VSLGHGVEAAYFSQQELELDTRGSVLQCVQTMTGLSRPDAQSLLGKFLFSGWDEHEKAVSVLSGGERRRLALAVTVASGANFLVPTSRRTISTSRAARRSRRRSRRSPAPCCSCRTTARCSTRSPSARSRSKDCELHSYDGGWAEMLRRREERARRVAAAAGAEGGEEGEACEAACEAAERARADRGGDRRARVRGLRSRAEARGPDWTNVEVLAAHKSSRDALQALLSRWSSSSSRRRPRAVFSKQRLSARSE